MESTTELRVSYFDKSFAKLASFHFLERFSSKNFFWNLQRVLEFLYTFYILYILFLYSFLLYILLAKRTLDGQGFVPVQSTSFPHRNISWPFVKFCNISIMQLRISCTCVYIHTYTYARLKIVAQAAWNSEFQKKVVLFIVLP